jgi:hypothetical protein
MRFANFTESTVPYKMGLLPCEFNPLSLSRCIAAIGKGLEKIGKEPHHALSEKDAVKCDA